MRRALTLIASVGLIATVISNDQENFLKEREVDIKKEASVQKENDLEVDKKASFAKNENREVKEAKEVSGKQRATTDFERDIEAKASQLESNTQKAYRDANGNEECEDTKNVNHQKREGEMSVVERNNNGKKHKKVEAHEQLILETENISSEKNNDCEKVNSKKWMKKRANKKNFQENNNSSKNDKCVQKRGKGIQKNINEARKNGKNSNKRDNAEKSFVKVNRNRMEKDVEVKTEKDRSFDKKENSDRKESEQIKKAEEQDLKVMKEQDKKVAVEKEAEVKVVVKEDKPKKEIYENNNEEENKWQMNNEKDNEECATN